VEIIVSKKKERKKDASNTYEGGRNRRDGKEETMRT